MIVMRIEVDQHIGLVRVVFQKFLQKIRHIDVVVQRKELKDRNELLLVGAAPVEIIEDRIPEILEKAGYFL